MLTGTPIMRILLFIISVIAYSNVCPALLRGRNE